MSQTATKNTLTLPPLSLYVHVPWCVQKCPYCDFNSHRAQSTLPEAKYVDALIDDLERDLEWLQGREIESIFVGGGTPSLLSAHAYDTLLSAIKQKATLSKHCEITLEANPGTFEAQKFADYRACGINRLSIGIQSFNSEHLHALGRIHDGEQAQRAIAMAHDAGFERINLDLMHGLPNQTVEQALTDIELALSFGVRHLSWYQLTLEPNTEFYARPPTLPEDDALWDIQEAGQETLRQVGFDQYEISAYCKDNDQARHNLNYWQFGDYLGIGAGAHGKITLPSQGQIVRTQKWRTPKRYLSAIGHYRQQTHQVNHDELGFEALMNGLRLTEGIGVNDFCQRTGLSLDDIEKPLLQAQKKGLIECDQRIRPTPLGRLHLNQLLSLFLE